MASFVRLRYGIGIEEAGSNKTNTTIIYINVHIECGLRAGDFVCDDSSCIPGWFECDGWKDCPDGEDETKALCGPNHFVIQL